MYPVRNCTRHSAIVHHHHLTQSVRTDIQPHPSTAVTPSNTSWFTSTFNLRLSPCQHSTSSSHSRHSVTHISDSVHADIQPHPHTGGHCTHPQAAHVQIQQHPHTGGHTIRHSMFTTHNQITQSPQSVHQERQKKVPRNHIITLGIPPKSITQPYYHSWNTQAKHLVQCKSTTLCVPHRAVPKAHR